MGARFWAIWGAPFGRVVTYALAPHIAPMTTNTETTSTETTSTENFGDLADSRSWTNAVGRGMGKKCPQCGRGALFSGYTTTAPQCTECGLDLSGHQADDAPPYLTILIVGHTLIPGALAVKQLFEPALWLQFSIWLPLMIVATFWLLPISKGAMVGLQWANRMHGFADSSSPANADV